MKKHPFRNPFRRRKGGGGPAPTPAPLGVAVRPPRGLVLIPVGGQAPQPQVRA